MRNTREHPTEYELRTMPHDALAAYLIREADYLGNPEGQKQTAIARGIREAIRRLRRLDAIERAVRDVDHPSN